MPKLGFPFALLLLVACWFSGCASKDKRLITAEEMLPIVQQLGSYETEKVRDAIARIRSHPRRPTVDALRYLLKEEHFDRRVRVRIAWLLATWKDEDTGRIDRSGLPHLVEGLRWHEKDVRELAKEGLSKIGRPAVPYAADVLVSGQKANRQAAAEVLGQILEKTQSREAGTALKKRVIAEKDREVRFTVLINLCRWRSEEAIEGFIDALTDPNEGCRTFAWRELEDRFSKKKLNLPVDFDPLGDLASRSKDIQKLRQWWEKRHGRR